MASLSELRLSARARLWLRCIASRPSPPGWCPGDRWADDRIEDEVGGKLPTVGGASDVRILNSLLSKGLILKPYDGWYGLRVTDEGRAVVAQLLRRAGGCGVDR